MEEAVVGKLRHPALGPIVGHTTPDSCRIWIRAALEDEAGNPLDSSKRTVGVLGLLRDDRLGSTGPMVHYFRLRREFDRTGTLDVGEERLLADGLHPGGRYRVKVGCLVVGDPDPPDVEAGDAEVFARLPDPSVWAEQLLGLDPARSEATFQTFPNDGDAPEEAVSFMIGSCRHPGLLWKRRHSDRIFGAMSEMLERPDPPMALFNVGGQVYADMFDRPAPIEREQAYEKYRQRYTDAYSTPNFRRLTRSIPTYMAIGSHEIEHNWSRDRLVREGRHLQLAVGIDAYHNYQWSFGPRSWGKALYHYFELNGYPVFSLDTRTQRNYGGDPADLSTNHLLGAPANNTAVAGQLERLCDWLQFMQQSRGNAPKFIISPGPFMPNPMSARTVFAEDNPAALGKSESWAAFPETRAEILQTVVDRQVQNVVWLSGDIHCSCVARMEFSDEEGTEHLRMFSITSSALYRPFPFADGDPSDFVHDSTAHGQEDSFHFETRSGERITANYKAWNFTRQNNFTLVTIDRDTSSIGVTVYDRKGDAIREEMAFGYQDLVTELDLYAW